MRSFYVLDRFPTMHELNFSVLMVGGPRDKWLKAAIESVLGQEFPPREVVLLLNGCRDPIALGEIDDKRVQVIALNGSVDVPTARNIALGFARFPWSAVCDIDDVWRPNHLRTLAETIQRGSTQLALVGTRAVTVDAEGAPLGRPIPARPSRYPGYRLRLTNPFVHSAVAFRTSAAKAVGGYPKVDLQRAQFEDFGLWRRLARHFSVVQLADITVLYRESDGSASSSFRRNARYRTIRARITGELAGKWPD